MKLVLSKITYETSDSEDINIVDTINYFYHTHYLGLLAALMVTFFLAGYYFYFISKKYNQGENELFTSKALLTKYQTIFHLSLAHFLRSASLIYIVLTENITGSDLLSFINNLCHVVPSLVFISILFNYIQFLIEKYYEMKTKKSDIYFAPSIRFLTFLIYIGFLVITISCVIMKQYSIYFYISTGIISLLSLILGIVYLTYGIKIANFYSNYYAQLPEKTMIYERMLMISVIVGGSYVIRGLISFFISIDWFKNQFPSFISMNLWDFSVFVMNELLCSFVVAYVRKEKRKDAFLLEIENYEFNNNYNFKMSYAGGANKRDNNKDTNAIPDLEDPLLENFENEI